VEPEASFLVQVKNPDPPSGGRDGGGFHGLQSKRRAAFPAHLQGAFGSRRYVRSRHSLPRFLVREDAYVRASGLAPLRGGVLTRRPIVLRTAPLSATGRFLFRIGAGALR